jgi:hypothetical protein
VQPSESGTPRRRRTPGSRTQFSPGKSSSRRAMAERKDRTVDIYRAGSPPPTKPSIDYDVIQRQTTYALKEGAKESVSYTHDVLSDTLSYFKILGRFTRKPVSFLLFLYGLSWIGLWVTAKLQSAIFAPICTMPGASYLLPICSRFTPVAQEYTWTGHAKKADFPSLAKLGEEAFTPLLSNAAGGSVLSLELKRAELATADLITLVKVSTLTSRDFIADSLGEFVQDARRTSGALQTFNSKVSGAVDIILSINDYAFQQIAAAPDASILDVVIPWRKTKDSVTVVQFDAAMDTVSTQMERLVLEANLNIGYLKKLEEHLNTLREVYQRENRGNDEALDDLLASIWSKVGGNRKAVRTAKSNALILKDLGSYRKRAEAHVVGVLQTLQGMEADMADLRQRVAEPALVGKNVPVEVHLKSIRASVERLKENTLKAKQVEAAETAKVLASLAN